MRYVVHPLILLFATPVDEAGARALFYCTSDRYSVVGGTVPLVKGVEKSRLSAGGVFLSNGKSESVDNEKVLADSRARGVGEKVWKHAMDIFDACAAKAPKK